MTIETIICMGPIRGKENGKTIKSRNFMKKETRSLICRLILGDGLGNQRTMADINKPNANRWKICTIVSY